MAVIAGVLIALGFQMILTNLSLAAGVTAVGNIKDKVTDKDKDSSVASPRRKMADKPLGILLTSGLGIWTMITAAVSLFFASMFAVKLSLVPDNSIGLSLGLVIWAVFFMLMFYVESRFIGSLTGGVFNVAYSAVKNGISLILGKSTVSKTQSMIEDTVDKIRDEAEDFISDSDLKEKFDTLIKKIEPKSFDMENMRKELSALINDISIGEKEEDGSKRLFLNVAERNPKFSKKDVSTLEKIWDAIKSGLKFAGAGGASAAAVSIIKEAYDKKEERRKVRKEEVEDYLKRTDEPFAQPRLLEAELQEIFNNPTHSVELVNDKDPLFDKKSIATRVSAREGVDPKQAMLVADKVEEAINAILHQSKIPAIAKEKLGEMKDVLGNKKDEIKESIESKIDNFFSRVHRPELDFDLLKNEFAFIMHNPKLAPEVLKRKVKQLDRNSFASLLAATDKYSSADAEKILDKFEEVRATILMNLERAGTEISHKVDQVKTFALEQAENTRKTAVAASWWLLGTLIISAIAAALGGMTAF
jgi:hypothetical protein